MSSLNKKITSNKSKHLLVENELKKLETFDSSYFLGKSDFEEDGTQNYLVFQPMYRYVKKITGVGNGSYIYYWKSKGLSDADIDKYSGYGIGFDRHGSFSFPGTGLGRNVIIRTQGLEHTLTAEKMYSIKFTEQNKNFSLSLPYNWANSYLFINDKEIHKFKAKDSEIIATPLCLGNISKDWSIDN